MPSGVNAIWRGDALLEFGKAFWQLDLQKGFRMIEGGVHTHIVTSRFAVPLLIDSAKIRRRPDRRSDGRRLVPVSWQSLLRPGENHVHSNGLRFCPGTPAQ